MLKDAVGKDGTAVIKKKIMMLFINAGKSEPSRDHILSWDCPVIHLGLHIVCLAFHIRQSEKEQYQGSDARGVSAGAKRRHQGADEPCNKGFAPADPQTMPGMIVDLSLLPRRSVLVISHPVCVITTLMRS